MASYPLELSGERLQALIDQATERILAHVESLPNQPAAFLGDGSRLARTVREDLPEDPVPAAPLFDRFFNEWVPASFNTAGPGYLAYIPGGGLPHAAVADLIANSVNRYMSIWQAAPALAEIEATVIRWFCRLVGLPESARGVLASGGSMANFSAVVAARRARLPENFFQGTLYVSDQVHHSMAKAAMLAGFPAARIRSVPTDERFRLRLDRLEEAIAADRASGLEPFLVVASAGTTNTGAIDDLPGVAELARRHQLWFHVDAAYGGFFLLTDRGSARLAGMELADSITLDPHKGLFLPYGTGCLLVRDGADLERAHATAGSYLPHLQDGEFVDFCQLSPELSRDFRGLRVWLPIKLAGARAFREALDEKLDLAAWMADELARLPNLEIVAPPELSLFAFRLYPRGVEGVALDQLNRRFLAALNGRQRVHLSGTHLPCGFVLRICVLSFRTHRDRMEACLEDARHAAVEVLAAV